MDFKLIWIDRALSDLAEVVRHYREDEKSVERGFTKKRWGFKAAYGKPYGE